MARVIPLRYSLFVLMTVPVSAAEFRFDLTDTVSDGSAQVDVDLGMTFSSIERGSMRVRGRFTPALVQPASPDSEPPVFASDSVCGLFLLGLEESSWLDAPLRSYVDFNGVDGPFDFTLAIRTPLIDDTPTLLPSDRDATDRDFQALADGVFSIRWIHFHALATLYQEVESPRVDFDRIELVLEGVAVPEPGTTCLIGAWLATACLRMWGARAPARFA